MYKYGESERDNKSPQLTHLREREREQERREEGGIIRNWEGKWKMEKQRER